MRSIFVLSFSDCKVSLCSSFDFLFFLLSIFIASPFLLCFSVPLSMPHFVCLSVCLCSLYLSLSLSVSVSLSFSFLLSPYLSVSLSLCVSLSLFSLFFSPFHFFLSFFLFVFLSPSPVSPLSAIFLFRSSLLLFILFLSLSLFSLSVSLSLSLSLSILSLSLFSLSLSILSLSLCLSVCLSVFPYLPFLSLFLSCFAFRSRNSLNHSNVTQLQETTLSTIVRTRGGHDVGRNDDEIDSSGNLVPV